MYEGLTALSLIANNDYVRASRWPGRWGGPAIGGLDGDAGGVSLIPKVVDNDPFDRVPLSARAARPVDSRWPWCQPTTSGPQRGERSKEHGLRWAEMASWVPNGTLGGACPIRKASRCTPRLPRRPFRPIKWVINNDLWYKLAGSSTALPS